MYKFYSLKYIESSLPNHPLPLAAEQWNRSNFPSIPTPFLLLRLPFTFFSDPIPYKIEKIKRMTLVIIFLLSSTTTTTTTTTTITTTTRNVPEIGQPFFSFPDRQRRMKRQIIAITIFQEIVKQYRGSFTWFNFETQTIRT